MESYRAQEGLSKHELDAFSIAPAYYKWKQKQEFKPTRQMELGTLLHSKVLEQKVDYVAGPTVDRRTTAGKEEWKRFTEENAGKTIVTTEEFFQLQGAAESASSLLRQVSHVGDEPLVEVSMFWERGGVQCKGRPDLIGILDGKLTIIDVKTTTGIRYWDSKFFSLRYNIQAEWYRHGLMKNLLKEDVKFAFLVVDFDDPFMAQFVLMDDELMRRSTIVVDAELERFKKCQETGIWPSIEDRRTICAK